MSTEDYVVIPPDSTGKKLRALKKNVGGNDVYDEVVAVEDGNGNIIDPRQVTVTDLLRGLTDPATGQKVNEVDLTWNADSTVATIVFKDSGAVTLFTLTFTYVSGNVMKILRS
jgi:hypothetical protein